MQIIKVIKFSDEIVLSLPSFCEMPNYSRPFAYINSRILLEFFSFPVRFSLFSSEIFSQ